MLLLLLASCRGEPVPRDYQNNPPAQTNPADSPADAPMIESSTVNPEPSYGPEGTSGPYEPSKPAASPGKPVGSPTPPP
jgi:hypothetical protein